MCVLLSVCTSLTLIIVRELALCSETPDSPEKVFETPQSCCLLPRHYRHHQGSHWSALPLQLSSFELPFCAVELGISPENRCSIPQNLSSFDLTASTESTSDQAIGSLAAADSPGTM